MMLLFGSLCDFFFFVSILAHPFSFPRHRIYKQGNSNNNKNNTHTRRMSNISQLVLFSGSKNYCRKTCLLRLFLWWGFVVSTASSYAFSITGHDATSSSICRWHHHHHHHRNIIPAARRSTNFYSAAACSGRSPTTRATISISSASASSKILWGTTAITSALCASSSGDDDDSSDFEIVDVDFERVVVVADEDTTSSKRSRSKMSPSQNNGKAPSIDDDDDDDDDDSITTTTTKAVTEPTKKSLLDLSLDADPRWKTTRIPFCRGDEYIDAKLAFMVELEGVQYGIAVPYDDAVAIIVQEPAGSSDDAASGGNERDDVSVTYVDPDAYHDNDEYQELMEIMAAQVQKELGEEFMLRKTPKILTISGGLSQITDQWEKQLFGKPATVDELMQVTERTTDETIDDDISEFMAFMKSELGEEEFEKTMKEEPSDEDREWMNFFNVAGLGTQKDDAEALEALIRSMEDDLEETKGVRAEAEAMAPDTDGLSLKLISFDFGSGDKSYSLVKLLQPYVLVGKYCEEEMPPAAAASNGDDYDDEELSSSSESSKRMPRGDIRFDLLTPEEERVLIPKLESICQEDLSKAGLSLIVGGEKNKRLTNI